MKNSKLFRTISTCLAVCLFACMAMASGTDTKKESSAVKIKDQGTSADAGQQAENGGEDTTPASEAEDEIKYEITHTTFVHYKNSIDREEYCGIVEITNTGSSYLYLGSCKFDFEDDSGHLLQSDDYISSGPDVLAPGDKGYFFESRSLDDGVSLDNGINLVPNFTVEIAKNGADSFSDYPVSDIDLRDNKYGGLKVTGRITNETNEETDSIDVKIIAVFFDSNGEILDVAFTYCDPMGAGATTSFELSTLFGNENVKAENVASYTVIARKTKLFNF